jgi:hypothetical protein
MTTNPSIQKDALFLSVTLDEFDSKMRIYGTPEGLRYLASVINEIANDPQTDISDLQKSVFVQIRKSSPDNPLAEDSLSVTVGRMDRALDGDTSDFLSNMRNPTGQHQVFLKMNHEWASKE